VQSLVSEGGHVVVVAPDADRSIQTRANQQQIVWMRQPYDKSIIADAFLVIAATSDSATNRQVTIDAANCGILVCNTDDPATGSFVAPAVIKRGDLTIAVSTGGASPTLASVIRQQLEQTYGSEWSAWCRLFSRLRPAFQSLGTESDRSGAATKVLHAPEIETCVREDNIERAEAIARQCVFSHWD
jgi:precorrin-2 dehydrogenase/sirohydrochlorin ferrochelatase